jgi:hypothetical protein
MAGVGVTAITAREAVRRWCGQDDAREERPALTRVVRTLCDEHEAMEAALSEITHDPSGAQAMAAATLATLGGRR